MKFTKTAFPSGRQVFPYQENHMMAWAIIIFSVACALRVAFIFESNPIAAIRTPTPGMDVDLYWQSARLIIQGACSDKPCFEQMICSSALYPYWVAFWQIVLGQDMVLHRLFNALLASLSAVLMFRLMFKLTNRFRAALVCILIWAALPSLIFFDTTIYKVSLAIFFLTILLTLMVSDPSATTTFPFFIKGLLTALLLSAIFFLQSASFLFLVVVVVFYALHDRICLKKKLVLLSSTLGIFALVVMGYHFKAAWSDNPYPRCLPQKGIHFRIGFNERADGTYVKLPQIDSWPYGHNFQARMVAEVALGRPLTPAEADSFFIQQGLKYILGHPMASLGLAIKKTVLFFNNYQAKGADDFYLLRNRCHILSLSPFGHGLIVLFAGLGLVCLFESKQYRKLVLLAGFLGAVLVSNLIIFISWRYRLISLVPLIILASFGLVHFQAKIRGLFDGANSFKGKVPRFVCTVLIPMVVAGGVAYYPVIGAKGKQFYRNAVINERLSKAAERKLKQLHRDEKQAAVRPVNYTNRALLLKELHRHSEAYRIFKSICDRSRDNPTADYNYLVYLMWLGDYDQAVALMKKIGSEHPALLPRVTMHLEGIEKSVFDMFVQKRIT